MKYGMNRRGNAKNQVVDAFENELVKRAVPAAIDCVFEVVPRIGNFIGEYAKSYMDIRLVNEEENSRIKREKKAFAWEMEKKAMSAQAAQAEHECTIVNFKDYCRARA